MQPLIVRARLRNGFSALDPWSPAIDGILAYWVQRERVGEAEFAVAPDSEMSAVEGLPLGVERHGDDWWWQCSAPLYDCVTQVQRYYHRRFDADLAERHMTPQRARINVKAGPTKNTRNVANVRVCPEVVWHVIGDGEEIERLLSRCEAIGAKRGQGFGEVTQWTVETGGDESVARHRRPLPVEYAREHEVSGRVLEWSIRPPGRLRENQRVCVLP